MNKIQAPFSIGLGGVYFGEQILKGKYLTGEGKGILITTDGTLYEGNFKDNKLHGQGRMISSSGEVYEGSF